MIQANDMYNTITMRCTRCFIARSSSRISADRSAGSGVLFCVWLVLLFMALDKFHDRLLNQVRPTNPKRLPESIEFVEKRAGQTHIDLLGCDLVLCGPFGHQQHGVEAYTTNAIKSSFCHQTSS